MPNALLNYSVNQLICAYNIKDDSVRLLEAKSKKYSNKTISFSFNFHEVAWMCFYLYWVFNLMMFMIILCIYSSKRNPSQYCCFPICMFLWGKDQCGSWHEASKTKEQSFYLDDCLCHGAIFNKPVFHTQHQPVSQQRPQIMPTWTLSSTKETITSAQKPTSWDESTLEVWRPRRK